MGTWVANTGIVVVHMASLVVKKEEKVATRVEYTELKERPLGWRELCMGSSRT